jgi:hypothetical protein
MVLKPWEIAAKLLPSENGLVSVEQASDAEFQAWVVSSGLNDLVDEDGIPEWSFDDRCRLLNFALRKGYALKFEANKNNSNNSPKNSEKELFEGDEPPLEAS